MSTSPFPILTADLLVVLRALRKTVSDLGLNMGLGPVLLLLVYRRISQIVVKMERLVAQYQAGTLRRVTAHAVVPKRDDVETRTRAKPSEVLPGKFGWLLRQMGWQIAGNRPQLETVLYQPEMDALLIACPQAIRILRPLSGMLGMDPRFLTPGVVVGSYRRSRQNRRRSGFASLVRRWIGGIFHCRGGYWRGRRSRVLERCRRIDVYLRSECSG